MASMQLALAPFTLCSSWITREDGSFTTPSMAQEMKRFGASALPAGSTVQSATLIVTAAMGYSGGVLKIAGQVAAALDVTDQFQAGAEGNFADFSLLFSYRALGETGAAGGHISVCQVKSAVIEVVYQAGAGAERDESAYRAAALAPRREVRPRGMITYPGGKRQPLEPEHILAWEIHAGCAQGVLLGTASSALLEIALANAQGEWNPGGALRGSAALLGAEIEMEIGLRTAGEMVYAPAGKYIVEKLEGMENGPALRLTAYDEMANAMARKFQDGLTYPATLSQVLSEIIRQSGLQSAGALACNRLAVISARPDWGEECTLRQALAFVCAAGGSFAYIARSGRLTIADAWKQTPLLTLTPESYLEKNLDERGFQFNRLSVLPRNARDDGDRLTAAVEESLPELPGNTLYLEDNPLFVRGQALAAALTQGLKAALTGAAWRSVRVRWRGDPAVEIGTRLLLTDRAGNALETTIMEHAMAWDQGFSCESACVINTAELLRGGALTGGGMLDTRKIALESLTGSMIGSQTIVTRNLAANAVEADQIKAGAVTAEKLAAGAITAEKIQAGAIEADKIAAGAVEANKIKAGAVTAEKLAAGAVTAEKIAAEAVTAEKLAAGYVTAAKLAAGAVTAEKIAARTITAEKIAAGTVTAESGILADGVVGTAQIADGSITDAKIVGLTASKITAGTINAAEININNLNADNITAGTINGQRIPTLGGDKIEDGAISGVKIVNGAVETEKIKDGAVTAAKIVAEAVTAEKIAAGAVTANKILAGAVTADKLAANAVTADKIAANAITTQKLAASVGSDLDLSSNKSINLKVGAVEGRVSAAETQIAQNATDISLRATKTELDGLQIGGVNLMLDTKAYGGNGEANYTIVGALQTETYNGFAVRRGENTSDANALQFKMAYAFQPGESYTLSFWGKGSGAAQALITGYAYPCTSVSSEGTAGTDAGGANTFNVTSDWKRYWVTFTMGAWATVPTGKELWLRARNSTSGRVLDVCGLKLERGSRATDWSPSPEDPARSVKTSSVTVNGAGIWLDSTGEISLAAGGKINIQSGADEGNQILLGDLFSATDQGGVTGKTANFGSLLVGGNPAAALGGNIVVATAQPSGNGILWLKPSGVATVQYQRATPSTRSWWLNGTRVIESIAAKTTDVLPGGTIHYKLTLPLYALSRLEGVVVAPRLSKSGISGEVALGAQTISILGLNVLTLEGASAINLGAAPGTPITLTLDVTNGDGQKLFVQSDTTIQLEISNRTVASGGVQALEAYWIP